ncbi:GtrA family protein [Kitasatospora sp. NPDC096147]|uniref:GtrA family protein n=1 Tax=Kitasatospora sp. NPDC096147 TaxID=3364093 RepID=UPI0038062C6A
MTTTTEPKPSLVQKLMGLRGEALGFAIVGLSGVGVNFLVFWILISGFGFAPVRSNVVATLIAIGTNYLGYRYWLYKDRDAASRKREILLFLVFSGAGMLIETGILGFSRYVLGFDSHFAQLVAKTVGLGVGTVFRFVSYRTWVFKAIPELTEAEVVVEAEAALLTAEQPQLAK